MKAKIKKVVAITFLATSICMPNVASIAYANCGGGTNCGEYVRDAERDQSQQDDREADNVGSGNNSNRESSGGGIVGVVITAGVICLLVSDCRETIFSD